MYLIQSIILYNTPRQQNTSSVWTGDRQVYKYKSIDVNLKIMRGKSSKYWNNCISSNAILFCLNLIHSRVIVGCCICRRIGVGAQALFSKGYSGWSVILEKNETKTVYYYKIMIYCGQPKIYGIDVNKSNINYESQLIFKVL